MRVLGIDFTSTPRRRKPLTCVEATLDGNTLRAVGVREWSTFAGLESALLEPGLWIAGIDFPFGQSRRFIQNIGWPSSWCGYVAHARDLGRLGFRDALENYRKVRAVGDKEHRRITDVAAGSISPQKLYGVPVALMFFEGAPRLLQSGVSIPSLQDGDSNRIVVEAYPGVLARGVLGRRSYKQDTKSKQTQDQNDARHELLQKITNGALVGAYGLDVSAPAELADDPSGDMLDALLCSIQAAWAWTQRENGFGARNPDLIEGWIADPSVQAS